MAHTDSGAKTLEAAFAQAVAIMARLRAPDGCPWDREQTFATIRRYTVEETYEVLDAIDRQHWPDLMDELGDLFLQVLFYAQMAQESGHFTLQDVLENLNAKLVRRHPHVFGGELEARTPEEVLANWDAIKREEKAGHTDKKALPSLLDDVLRSLPALMEAEKLGKKAAKVGFDWARAQDVLQKLDEEIAELHAAVAAKDNKQQEEELGDLLFTVVNLSRKLGIDPEFALRSGNAKFRRRFSTMEVLARDNKPLEKHSPEELESLWEKSKKKETKMEQTAPDVQIAAGGPITVRHLHRQEEFHECVVLQGAVWGFDKLDLVPRRVFTVSRAVGGQVLGAYDGDRLAGFAMSVPGVRNGRPYLHSHMLAVRPQYRNRGIGALLKWAQRDDALARGVELIEWTFDPLVLKNAHLNIEKLGAVVRRYTPDFYGASTSAMHTGMPTDRLHAEWWLRSRRVERAKNKLPQEKYETELAITVPDVDHPGTKLSGEEALHIQQTARRGFQEAFAAGLAVLRFQIGPDGAGIYQLGHWDETWEY